MHLALAFRLLNANVPGEQRSKANVPRAWILHLVHFVFAGDHPTIPRQTTPFLGSLFFPWDSPSLRSAAAAFSPVVPPSPHNADSRHRPLSTYFSYNMGFRIDVTLAVSAFRRRSAVHQQVAAGEQARNYDQDDGRINRCFFAMSILLSAASRPLRPLDDSRSQSENSRKSRWSPLH